MLKEIELQNFTVFSRERITFAPGLNVIIGENGAGKSHLLKAAYSLIAAQTKNGKPMIEDKPTKVHLQKAVAEKIYADFRPETIGRLVRRKQGRDRCSVALHFKERELDTQISFSTASKTEVQVDRLPTAWHEKVPVFLPTRELLTIYPGFVSVYENYHLEFEETWRDTCVLLGAPALKGPRQRSAAELLLPLEEAMGGKVLLEKNGRFYLSIPGSGKMEMALVAEGLRKIAMIARLIATGSLMDKGYLFWDEPESNLNPRLIRQIALTILHLCKSGIQVFIATHSLFLLRELEIAAKSEFKDVTTRFITLQPDDDGIKLEQADSIDDVEPVVALDEELAQSDRYLTAEGE